MTNGKFESMELHYDTNESLSRRLDSVNNAAQSLLFELREFRGFMTDPSIFNELEDALIPDGGDFYSEVQRFEIGLIEVALILPNPPRSPLSPYSSLFLSALEPA